MKKLGILLLAAAFAVFGLFSFAACNEETLGPGDDPIVTPGPDDPGKPEEPTPPDEPEATEGLVFELITAENSVGFEAFLGADFEDFYACIGMSAAEENVVIPSTYNGLPVRAFSWYGMEDDILSGITSFYIPDSVQVVQWGMWGEYEIFENLTEIRLPRNPNAMIYGSIYLSGCAFYNDPNNWEDGALYMDDWLLATNDDLPEEYTVKQGTYGIASGAFDGSSVKKVTVLDGVQALVGSFADCASLEEVVLPDSLSSIGYGVFYGCSSLTSIDIPDSVTSIGDSAFFACDSLESVTMGNNITSIGDSAFYWCVGLTSIVIPDSVTSIGDSAFYLCFGLTSITIPDSVTFIGYGAFSGTAYYNNASNWEDGVLYIGNHLIGAEETIFGNFSVREGTKTIAGEAFEDCSALTSIIIPDGVTSIGDEAFAGCVSLTSIAIPDSVTFIGDSAFMYCFDLTSIVIPDSVTSIGYGAFSICDSLTSVAIPDSVTSIGEGAFSGCNSLTSFIVDTGNAVYHSDGNCLIETQSKTLIAGCGTSVIPSDGSVTSIGEGAFSNCESLMSITIPDSVTSIGSSAFSGCSGLTSIVIPDSVTSIGDSAFYYCSSLESITIPDSVTSIGEGAFSRCNSLTSFIVDTGNAVYHSDGNCLIETQSKTLIAGCGTSVIPSDGSVTSIGEGAFSNCESLMSITIPDSVISIGEWAFTYCRNLTSVTIGDSVTSIGDYAFYDCDSLETVYYRGSEAEWNEIEIGADNDDLLNAEIIFNYTGE